MQLPSLSTLLHRGFEKTGRLFVGDAASKKRHELAYWAGRYSVEGPLAGPHYQYFYTEAFGLSESDYAGKRVLDIGCGPRGSLEWADMALERVGLDPLADDYKKFGADQHKMSYVASPSEKIPFSNGHFDVVITFNSLDHVDNLDWTISEIGRVTRSGGQLLLIVEIDHPPTPTEPISLHSDVLNAFSPPFTVLKSWRVAVDDTHDIYGSIRANVAPRSGSSSILCARLLKQ